MRFYNYEEVKLYSKAEIFNLLADMKDIPTIPGSIDKLYKMITSKDVKIGDIAQLINRDPAIAAKVLSVANTALYSQGQEISSIEKAIMRIGIKEIHNIILGASTVKSFTGLHNNSADIEFLWKHSIGVAFLNKLIGNILELDDEDLWICGLMHNIGKIIYISIMPDVLIKLYNESKSRSLPFHVIEREFLRFNNAEVGTWLLKKWGLPTKLQQVVMNYYEPPANKLIYGKNTDAIGITHISSSIIKFAGIGDSGDIITGISANVWNYFDKELLNEKELVNKVLELGNEVNDMFSVFIS